MTEQASFRTYHIDGVPVVEVTGEIDIANVGEFRDHLERAISSEGEALVISMEGVVYFDSRTVETIAQVADRVAVMRRTMVMVAPGGGAAAKILRISGLNVRVPVFKTIAEAIAAIKSK
jgi:anti-anti-sigma factor